MLEVGAHDHWEDLKYYVDEEGVKYRNVLIATGLGMNHE